ncbi:MAG TPA: DNA-primase RepB domain-containing protein [Bryobacteraceae bacterium]|nr:DNA-primase RepB domain-containing protein [Bryobacteraceae bacterium]
MNDRGFFLTLQAIRRQLGAMPNELYLVRLIHQQTRKPFPGERLWTAQQLGSPATVRFLRARNREGCDIYVQPYAGDHNAGYILVDLDRAELAVIATMRARGHDPCVVLQTSPGRLQAWIRLSIAPLEPAVATAAGKLLATAYGGDPASTDGRHLGRLAGFTNQKPARRTHAGYAPWVKVVETKAGSAPQAQARLHSARAWALLGASGATDVNPTLQDSAPVTLAASVAVKIYQDCVERWHIRDRFPHPDWSIVDLWIAGRLLSQRWTPAQVHEILRLASPQFPRRHGNPDDYLRRTIARAAFPHPRRPVCAAHARASSRLEDASTCSNSTGGRYPSAECSRFWL